MHFGHQFLSRYFSIRGARDADRIQLPITQGHIQHDTGSHTQQHSQQVLTLHLRCLRCILHHDAQQLQDSCSEAAVVCVYVLTPLQKGENG